MGLLYKLIVVVITPPLLVGKPWGSINLRLIALCLCLILSGCVDEDGHITTGFDFSLEYQWCSNPETLQSQSTPGDCPEGWWHGTYNDCVNTITKKLVVTPMEGPQLCPAGFTGGAVHDQCAGFLDRRIELPSGTVAGHPDCL